MTNGNDDAECGMEGEPMSAFPEFDAVESELLANYPLAVLFGHGCSDRSHEIYKQLQSPFAEVGLALLRDPFELADSLDVAMRRLDIHGLVFLATAKSISSTACALELETARNLAAPIVCVKDGVKVPEPLYERIFLELGGMEPQEFPRVGLVRLARGVVQRARVHWVWRWLMHTGRGVVEREGAVNWLLEQPPQVLAEFLEPLAGAHRLEDEDPTVSSLLAAVVERTGLRRQASRHLARWWEAVRHPLSRNTIEDIFSEWGISRQSFVAGEAMS